MVGIAFFFEHRDVDVWSGHDLDAWHLACRAAGDVDRVHVVNRTDQALRWPDSTVGFTSSRDLGAVAGRVAYVCCPWDRAHVSCSLWDFTHNVDWYAFGPANGWGAEVPLGVHVPQAGRGALHAVHVASAVLLHRYGVLSWR